MSGNGFSYAGHSCQFLSQEETKQLFSSGYKLSCRNSEDKAKQFIEVDDTFISYSMYTITSHTNPSKMFSRRKQHVPQ